MRVYISGAITGTDSYQETFNEAELSVNAKLGHNIKIINPARVLAELPEIEYEEYMKICLCLLDMCDMIYMIDGWQQSKGANREYGYALAKDMTIIKGDVYKELFAGQQIK